MLGMNCQGMRSAYDLTRRESMVQTIDCPQYMQLNYTGAQFRSVPKLDKTGDAKHSQFFSIASAKNG